MGMIKRRDGIQSSGASLVITCARVALDPQSPPTGAAARRGAGPMAGWPGAFGVSQNCCTQLCRVGMFAASRV